LPLSALRGISVGNSCGRQAQANQRSTRYQEDYLRQIMTYWSRGGAEVEFGIDTRGGEVVAMPIDCRVRLEQTVMPVALLVRA
jgi:hypothetical protein